MRAIKEEPVLKEVLPTTKTFRRRRSNKRFTNNNFTIHVAIKVLRALFPWTSNRPLRSKTDAKGW